MSRSRKADDGLVCGYALEQTCRRPVVDVVDGVPVCGPCKLMMSLGQKKRHAAVEEERRFGGGHKPRSVLSFIPEDWPDHQCGCGCTEKVKKKRGFRPGHDAKLKSRLKAEGKW